MNLKMFQISSLEKIRSLSDIPEKSVSSKELLCDEEFSYQIALHSESKLFVSVSLSSPIAEHIRLYTVQSLPMDYPVNPSEGDEDYITHEPGIMPELLVPIEECANQICLHCSTACLWVRTYIPKGFAAGVYPIDITFSAVDQETGEQQSYTASMQIEVLPAELPKQETVFTQWFHVDCIASAHNVPIYSREHWALIDKYMAMAHELGINMLLTPVITPPLDTDRGTHRPITQLVKIQKHGERYSFDFSLMDKWIELCEKNHIEFFEISHLFSQWGLESAPNIVVNEGGEDKLLFGWHVPARDDSYRNFLQQFLPELIKFIRAKGIFERCYFHLSDEPMTQHMENYRYAYELVTPLLDGAKCMDALSDVNFYNSGLISIPVTANDHIDAFLEKNCPNQWVYYCCAQGAKVANRFMAMPSYRNRIIGVQIYKHDIKGFLHWGYNFYYSRLSRHSINPYVVTSAAMGFPSGDAFSVYPHKDGVLPSLRAVVFKEALQDIRLLKLAENYIGKDEVLKLLDIQGEITFSEYPRNSDFLPELNDKLKAVIKEHTVKN